MERSSTSQSRQQMNESKIYLSYLLFYPFIHLSIEKTRVVEHLHISSAAVNSSPSLGLSSSSSPSWRVSLLLPRVYRRDDQKQNCPIDEPSRNNCPPASQHHLHRRDR